MTDPTAPKASGHPAYPGGPAPQISPPDHTRWREPSSRIPLRWGHYPDRLAGGLLLICAGGLAIAGGSATTWFASTLLWVGTLVHATGWAILPAAGWRRVLALGLSTLSMWFLLTGPGWVAILTLPYAGWLLVRHRPAASYLTVLLVLGGTLTASAVFGVTYSGMVPALAWVAVLMTVSAWLARAIHAATQRVRRGRKPKIPQG